MQIDDPRRRRTSPTIEFTDTRAGAGSFAKGWFFWVPSAFKGSLDISSSEYIDSTKTSIIRDRMSQKLFGVSHEEFKRRIKESGRKLTDDTDHMHIQSYDVRDIRETEGSPPLYSFREGDLLESRCGTWYVQVKTASSDSVGEEGKIGFWLLPGGAPWPRDQLLETSPRDFVVLLRTGRCAVVDLTLQPDQARREYEPTTSQAAGARNASAYAAVGAEMGPAGGIEGGEETAPRDGLTEAPKNPYVST